jgi:plastocyanin
MRIVYKPAMTATPGRDDPASSFSGSTRGPAGTGSVPDRRSPCLRRTILGSGVRMSVERPALTSIVAIAALVALTAEVRATSMMIEQAGQLFSEKTVALSRGDTLTFQNHDDVTHNINIVNDDDEATDLGLQKPGTNLVYKFDKAGRFKIRCSIHPSMKMTANVQ